MGMRELECFLSQDKFLGLKHTSNDFFALEQCKSRFPDKIVYNGFDEMFLSGLSMGADGAIGSTYNFMANKFVAIKKLFEEQKTKEALAIQGGAHKIITVLCKVGVMKAEKEVINQLGFDFGLCRHPFGEPTLEDKKLIEREILPLL